MRSRNLAFHCTAGYHRSSRRGAMIVMIVFMMIVFLGMVAFAVDIAYMHLVRSELRTATDAASKAASQTLVRTSDLNVAIRSAQEIAQANLVAGKGLQLAPSDIVFGNAQQSGNGAFQFTANGRPFNSVRVNGRRTQDSLGGSVPLHFGRIFSVNSFQPSHVAQATFLDRDVVLVVDRSGSMAGQKFADLKSAVASFIGLLKSNSIEEQVGLASYSSSASQDVQLTKDLDATNRAMAEMLVAGATSISAGIIAGQGIMNSGRSPEFVERTMIVMTDGVHNTGIGPEGPAQQVANSGVIIHTITFGSDIDEARMRNIARIGRGRYFHANTGQDLTDAFEEIARTLSTILTE